MDHADRPLLSSLCLSTNSTHFINQQRIVCGWVCLCVFKDMALVYESVNTEICKYLYYI